MKYVNRGCVSGFVVSPALCVCVCVCVLTVVNVCLQACMGGYVHGCVEMV